MSNITPIRTNEDSKEVALSYVRQAMDDLLIYAASLSISQCEIARAVGYRLGVGMLHNDLDVARELIEKGAS